MNHQELKNEIANIIGNTDIEMTCPLCAYDASMDEIVEKMIDLFHGYFKLSKPDS